MFGARGQVLQIEVLKTEVKRWNQPRHQVSKLWEAKGPFPTSYCPTSVFLNKNNCGYFNDTTVFCDRNFVSNTSVAVANSK